MFVWSSGQQRGSFEARAFQATLLRSLEFKMLALNNSKAFEKVSYSRWTHFDGLIETNSITQML